MAYSHQSIHIYLHKMMVLTSIKQIYNYTVRTSQYNIFFIRNTYKTILNPNSMLPVKSFYLPLTPSSQQSSNWCYEVSYHINLLWNMILCFLVWLFVIFNIWWMLLEHNLVLNISFLFLMIFFTFMWCVLQFFYNLKLKIHHGAYVNK